MFAFLQIVFMSKTKTHTQKKKHFWCFHSLQLFTSNERSFFSNQFLKPTSRLSDIKAQPDLSADSREDKIKKKKKKSPTQNQPGKFSQADKRMQRSSTHGGSSEKLLCINRSGETTTPVYKTHALWLQLMQIHCLHILSFGLRTMPTRPSEASTHRTFYLCERCFLLTWNKHSGLTACKIHFRAGTSPYLALKTF